MTRPLSRVRSGRPGSADGPSLARSGIGAIPRADPSGLIVRPPPRHTGLRAKAESRASAATLCGFCGQDGRALLLSGVPLCRGEDAEGKARRGARRRRARSLSAHGCAVSEPPQRPRVVAGWSRRPRYRGCPSLWLLSLGQARESDRRAGMRDVKHTDVRRVSRNASRAESKELDPGFRRDDVGGATATRN